MESLLARLVTYKFMDGPGLVNDLFNQPKEKLLFSLLLFMLIIGSSLCIVYRTLFQRGSSVSKSSTHKNIDPQLLVNLWTDQNRNLCTGIVDLCVAFINTYTDRVKVPNGVKNVLYLPRVSSPVIYSQRSPPTVSANIMVLAVKPLLLSFLEPTLTCNF